MGTRSSKHNKGRKPRYKDFNPVVVRESKRLGDILRLIPDGYPHALGRFRELTPTQADLEQMADDLLSKHGSDDLVLPRPPRGDIAPESFTPLAGRHSTPALNPAKPKEPKANVYVPKGDIEYKVPKGAWNKCRNCGRACQGQRCAPCYRAQAKSTHQRALALVVAGSTRYATTMAKRHEARDASWNAAVQRLALIERWFNAALSEPDFAPELIEQISEVEDALGVPIFRWFSHPEFSGPRPAKRLFGSNDAVVRMSSAKVRSHVRQDRKSVAMRQGKRVKRAA